MSNRKDIEELMQLSQQASKQMKNQMNLMDANFKILMKELPADQSKEVSNLQVLSKKAFALAKEGKTEEAQELIKNYKNGR
jgi:hypothetical protein